MQLSIIKIEKIVKYTVKYILLTYFLKTGLRKIIWRFRYLIRFMQMELANVGLDISNFSGILQIISYSPRKRSYGREVKNKLASRCIPHTAG